MADRVVTVRMRADVSGYLTSMRAAERATNRVAVAAEQAGTRVQRSAAAMTTAMTRMHAQTSAAAQASQSSLQALGRQSATHSRQAAQGMATWQRQMSAGWSQTIQSGRQATRVQGLTAAQMARQIRAADRQMQASYTSMSRAAANAARSQQVAARSTSEAWQQAAGQMGTSGVLAMGGFLLAANGAMRFQKEMSAAKAVLSPTAAEFDALRAAALQAGRETSFSASEAAQAITELGRAGMSTEDILSGGLRGALDLAAAGQLSTAEAAEVAADAMIMFGLQGKDLAHVADLLAAAANKSSTDVHQMGFALKQAGLLASQTGLSIEDTAAALAMFASAGLKGSDAGTSLKVMLQMLVPKSDEARRLMEQLGFSAYDAQGNFVGLTEVAARLQKSFGNLTPEARNAAMATIFGTDAVRAATILYTQGASGVDKWREAVNDSGAAGRTAAVMLDNLAGDLEHLKGALEVAAIEGGTPMLEMLSSLVEAITKTVNAFNNLKPGAQAATVYMIALFGVIGLLSAALMLAVPKFLAYRAAMASLATQAPRTAAAIRGVQLSMAMLGGAIPMIIAGLMMIGSSAGKAAREYGKFSDAIKQDGGQLGDATRAQVAHAAELSKMGPIAAKAGISLEELTAAILDQPGAYDLVNQKIREWMETGQAGAQDILDFQRALEKMRDELARDKESADRLIESGIGLQDGMEDMGDQARTTAEDLDQQRDAADRLKESLDALNGSFLSFVEAQISAEEAADDLAESFRENGRSLDVGTEAGRANVGAIIDMVKASQELAAAKLRETGSHEQANAILAAQKQKLIDTMVAAGMTREAAARLADQYFKIPTDVQTDIIADASKAIEGAAAARTAISNVRDRTVHINVAAVGLGAAMSAIARIGAAAGALAGAADGGLWRGGVRRMADGGRTGRQAMIAPGGSYILWAESETEDESYIPWAPSKRTRATQILRQTATGFGYDLVPQGGRSMVAASLAPAAPPAPAPAAAGGVYDVHVYMDGREITDRVDVRLREHDRQLARAIRTRKAVG